MTRLIRTRQGAILYAIAAPLLAGLLLLLWCAVDFGRAPDAGMILLSILLGFGTCTLVLLIRWAHERLQALVSVAVASAVLTVLALFPVWVVSVIVGVPLWGISLICLAQGRYPQGALQLRRWWVLLIPLGLIALALMTGEANRAREVTASAPGATPAEAFASYRAEEAILAELPQEDGSVLVLGENRTVCRMAQTDGLWRIAEVYRLRTTPIETDTAVIAYCSRGSGPQEVVWVWKQEFDMPAPFEDRGVNARAQIPPRDTAGSEFMHFRLGSGSGTTHFYVTLTDVDAPGYTLYGE